MRRTPHQYHWNRRQWRNINSGRTTAKALLIPQDAKLVRIGGDVYLYTPDKNTPNHIAKWEDDVQRTKAKRIERYKLRQLKRQLRGVTGSVSIGNETYALDDVNVQAG